MATEQVAQNEEQANPYNQKKSWHKPDDKKFVSADDSLFFEEPQNRLFDSNDITQTENVNTEELESPIRYLQGYRMGNLSLLQRLCKKSELTTFRE